MYFRMTAEGNSSFKTGGKALPLFPWRRFGPGTFAGAGNPAGICRESNSKKTLGAIVFLEKRSFNWAHGQAVQKVSEGLTGIGIGLVFRFRSTSLGSRLLVLGDNVLLHPIERLVLVAIEPESSRVHTDCLQMRGRDGRIETLPQRPSILSSFKPK